MPTSRRPGLQDRWGHVFDSLESIIPIYELGSSRIAFFSDSRMRDEVVAFAVKGSGLVLDLGSGPGTMARVVSKSRGDARARRRLQEDAPRCWLGAHGTGRLRGPARSGTARSARSSPASRSGTRRTSLVCRRRGPEGDCRRRQVRPLRPRQAGLLRSGRSSSANRTSASRVPVIGAVTGGRTGLRFRLPLRHLPPDNQERHSLIGAPRHDVLLSGRPHEIETAGRFDRGLLAWPRGDAPGGSEEVGCRTVLIGRSVWL
jgi:hypothetical protein